MKKHYIYVLKSYNPSSILTALVQYLFARLPSKVFFSLAPPNNSNTNMCIASKLINNCFCYSKMLDASC